MTLVLDQTEWDGQQLWSASAKDLESQVRNVLEHAVDGYRRRLRVYESLRNLNEVVGTQYGDRVGELIAPFAHRLLGGQDGIRGAHRTQVLLFVEERCDDLRGRVVDEARRSP